MRKEPLRERTNINCGSFPMFLSFDLITALITIEIKEIQTSGEVKGVIG